jgi:ribosomal protein S18 acetylase RimI-like enzyme
MTLILLRPITPQNLASFKAVRLRALEDAPYAFGSTFTREATLSDAKWLARAHRWNGIAGVGYLAVESGSACGIAGALVDPAQPARAQIVSVWTAPEHRRKGVGRRLTNEVIDWAQSRGLRELVLKVTNVNAAAVAFYEQLGFAKTGRVEPYANDPNLVEHEMLRKVP